MNFFLTTVLTVVLFNCVSSRQHRHHHDERRREMHPLSREFIHFINTQQRSWLAGRNFARNTPLSYIKGLMGTVMKSPEDYKTILDVPPKCESRPWPVNFDAREYWPYCTSIREIRDQGGCGSCWAVGVASVITDRTCILTYERENLYLSEEDILTCCPNCLSVRKSLCSEGFVDNAWAFAKKTGVVSGGDYNSTGGCKSYEFKPCNHKKKNHRKNACQAIHKTRRCQLICTSNPEIGYIADKKKITSAYHVPDPMCEIFNFGPVAATMNIYNDFVNYKNGVYIRLDTANNKLIGNHTVKILGWGVDRVTRKKYWLAANSWNTGWGEKGFFKILRGENHCNIEINMTAGRL